MPRSRVRIFQFRKIFGNLCLENRDKDDERKQIHENNNKIHLSYFCGVRRHHARARRCRSRNGPSITTKETTIQQRAIAAYSSKAYRSTGHARGRIATGLLLEPPQDGLGWLRFEAKRALRAFVCSAARIADSSSRNAVSLSSACTMKRFPSSRCICNPDRSPFGIYR